MQVHIRVGDCAGLNDSCVTVPVLPSPSNGSRLPAQLTVQSLWLPEGVLRIGIRRGLIARRKDGDMFGDAVNVASRLEGIAEPGQVVVSAAVKERFDEPGVLQPLGQHELKNVAEPVECWAVAD